MRWVIFFLLSHSLLAMDMSERETEERLQKVGAYFLGAHSSSLRSKVVPYLKDKINTNITVDKNVVWEAVDALDISKPLVDSPSHNTALSMLKAMVVDTVEEVLNDSEQKRAEAAMQLRLKQKELKHQRATCGCALLTLGVVSGGSLVTLLTYITT